MTTKTTLSVYMNDGRVFEYSVRSDAAREHASAIIASGYRHTPENETYLEWYPPHRIAKVKIAGAGESNYKDTTRAT
jgi:hypothetical protein